MIGTWGKLGLAALGLGGAGAAGFLLAQQSGIGQTQKASAVAPVSYVFNQTPGGGPQNVYDPSGGTATVDQKQTATSFDMGGLSNLVILGGVVLGALIILPKLFGGRN